MDHGQGKKENYLHFDVSVCHLVLFVQNEIKFGNMGRLVNELLTIIGGHSN